MNDYQMHEFFRRRELEMIKPVAGDDSCEMHDARFDAFVKSRNGNAFGFYIHEDFSDGLGQKNWDAVLWIPRRMIEDKRVQVKRLNAGFEVSMPVWFANRNGVI